MKGLIFNHVVEQLCNVANMWFKNKRLPYLIKKYMTT